MHPSRTALPEIDNASKCLKRNVDAECELMTLATTLSPRSEIVRQAYLLRRGLRLPGIGDPRTYQLLVHIPGAG